MNSRGRDYLGGTSRGGGLRYLALMCKKGFLEELSSAMLAASDNLMLSSMAACVIAPFIEILLLRGLKSVGVARLMLRVFFGKPFVPLNVFFGSFTGVEARLWLRALRAPASVGVLTALVLLFFLTWLSLSVPQKVLFSSFCTCARLILRDFLGALVKEVDVNDFRCSTGGVLTDLPVGVLGVLKLEGADCFLVRGAGDFGCRPSTESARSGKVKADRRLLAGAGLLGVEVRLKSGSGELLPLLALLEARVDLPLRNSTGEVLPLMEEALLSMGEMVPLAEGSCVGEARGEARVWAGGGVRGGAGSAAGSGAGSAGSGSTARRPGVTSRTWQGSWRDRKCSSVSQPPPTRTIMWRPFSSCSRMTA